MPTLPSKLLFALAGLALSGVVGYGVATGERTGLLLLAALAIVAVVLGVASLAVSDTAPFLADDAPPPDPRATTPGAPARDSGWPLAVALALGVVAIGAAIDAALVYAGVFLGMVAGLGWFARAWSEHSAWTPRVRERVDYRLVVPLGLPLTMVALTLVIAGSLSRVLLAVDKSASVAIAMLLASALLVAFSLIALRPGVGSSALAALSVLAGISVVGAGIAGAAQGERHFEKHPPHVFEVEVAAKDVAFEVDELVVPAEEEIELTFRNLDDDIYHNVAVYGGSDPAAEPLYNGRGFPGVETRTYRFRTPEAGTYVFVCDFHANMRGQFVVDAYQTIARKPR